MLGLGFRARLAARAAPYPQQLGIEDLLLSLGVDLQERSQPCPDGAERRMVAAVDLLEDGEKPPLLMVVVEDQLRDVDGCLSSRLACSLFRARLEQPRRLAFGRQSPLRRELVDSFG
jgi:hypothetical protein